MKQHYSQQHQGGQGLPEGLLNSSVIADAGGGGGGGSFVATPQFKSIETYLCSVCPPMLGVPLTTVAQAIHIPAAYDAIYNFYFSIDNCQVLFIGASSSQTSTSHQGVEVHSDFKRLMSIPDIMYVALVKSVDSIDPERALHSQIQVITLNGDSFSDNTAGNNVVSNYIPSLYRYTQQVYSPIAKITSSSTSGGDSSAAFESSNAENFSNLQKKIRDVEVAMETCQSGAFIPRANIQVHQMLHEVASSTNTVVLKGLLEKFNPSQVDVFFSELSLDEIVLDSSFRDEVNKLCRTWPLEIGRQTKLIDFPFPGSIDAEVNFWRDLEKKLSETALQMQHNSVLITRLLLKRYNRVQENGIAEAEKELDRSIENVMAAINFLRDFPFDDLINLSNKNRFCSCISNILSQFPKLKSSKYDFNRALRLLETVGKVVLEKVVSMLADLDIVNCPMDALRAEQELVNDLYSTWSNDLKTVTYTLKEIAKRRNERLRNLHFDLDTIINKFIAIVNFREQHEKLVNVFEAILSGKDSRAIIDLQEAYELYFGTIGGTKKLLDSSSDSPTWSLAQKKYDKKLDTIETRIKDLIDKRLKGARNAEEMFRIFSEFNSLFFRPSIRNAVTSYQSALMASVRQDVKRLQDKFRCRYDESAERTTAILHDVPPLSGKILWAKQIEHQLSAVIQKLENVLGRSWENNSEGKQLKEVCDELLSHLNVNQYYKDWVEQNLKQMKDEDDRFRKTNDYLLLVDEDHRTGHKYLRVNFDDKNVILFKEVRYLTWLLPQMTTIHQTIPVSIMNQSMEAYSRYPIATALDASISSYRQVLRSADDRIQLLLATHIRSVRETINEAFFGISKRYKEDFIITWQSHIDSSGAGKDSLGNWSNQLSSKVYSLQERVEDISKKISSVDSLLESFKYCAYDKAIFSDLITNIQSIIDDIQSRGYANIANWVNRLENQLEDILIERIRCEIGQWMTEFKSGGGSVVVGVGVDLPHGGEGRGGVGGGAESTSQSERRIIFQASVHEVMLANQTLFVEPPLERARIDSLANFYAHLGILTSLPRLITSRFNVFANTTTENRDHSNILKRIDPTYLYQPILLIEEKISLAHRYVDHWLQYQALWDASVSIVADVLGRDIRKWQQLLIEIKAARSTIDSVDEQKFFGAITIIHRQIQNKVRDKYDSWQKECQAIFGQILYEDIKSIKGEIVELKSTVESVHFDGQTKEVILGVECILKANTYVSSKVDFIEGLEASEHLLQKQRYQFPKNWESAQILSSIFTDLRQVLTRRTNSMQQQLQSLQQRIREEDAAISVRTDEVIANWEEKRPIDGKYLPADALHRLSVFMTHITKVKDEVIRIRVAKQALGLDFIPDDKLTHIVMEITDLKEVWHTVAPTHDKLNALRQINIRSLQFLKIKQQLDVLVEDLRSYPAKLRSYGAVEWLQDKVSKYLSYQTTIKDLTNESLKDRHWRQLIKVMGASNSKSGSAPSVTPADITLGMIWDFNPAAHKTTISEVLSTAQGEQAIEVFLKELKENWTSMEINMANKDGLRMVIGWDVIFTALEDNLNSLASLKQSPYYKSVTDFQEDTMNWEAKLLALRKIFEIWLEVQRKWLYLRGIFNNSDIKAQLPAQFTKFKSIDSEIVSLMKRVVSKPLVIELLQVDNLDRQLERQESTMSTIQKALGEYLERQRQVFPRFYFVNNDDLVEILGNSNEPGKIVHHLVKMFSAISSFVFENQRVVAIASREGEVVPFQQMVEIGSANAKDWLGVVEIQMKSSIASILQDALLTNPASGSTGGPNGALTCSSLLEWMVRYPVQVVLLSSQIFWTSNCDLALSSNRSLSGISAMCDYQLRLLSEAVLLDLESILRKKCEQILTETVHQRDITRSLVDGQVSSQASFSWQYHLRFYWNPKENDVLNRLVIQMSNATFLYGFEYLGVGERLVQTPLTDRCYLTLTQALHCGMGGNPFGPAGTGKTESVKMLGSNLGRFVLVFNCDASFDYNAMGRIFAGLCQVGAWGCFDEFNRLEERILSAVSQQILTIQRGLLQQQDFIELLGESCKLHKDVGIFITMNPGYAGRSNLPDNLKQLFRAVAMVTPDRKLIAQVMLFSQGIVSAEELASKIVLLFILLEEQLSAQVHYDFSLRALKSVLVGAGDLKRVAIQSDRKLQYASSSAIVSEADMHQVEIDVLIRSTCNNILPKLVSEDIVLYNTLLASVFPRVKAPVENDAPLIEAIRTVCREDCFEFDESWVSKVLQLKQVIDMRHGIMLMGSSGVGKTSSWKTLLKALAKIDGIKGDSYVIEPKTARKEVLYGSLDPITLEWTDGIFTKILRKLSETQTETRTANRRSWIVFDGDVDPEWAENLNSVLDDNKVLTLPSGDRLKIPDNVRIIMEVDNLKYATLATISRCGMVWYPDETLSIDLIFQHQLNQLKNEDLSKFELAAYSSGAKHIVTSEHYKLQYQFVDFIGANFYLSQGLVSVALDYALLQPHIMEPSIGRLLTSLYSSVVRGILLLIEQSESIGGITFISDALLESFASKWVLFSLLWSFGGSMSGDDKAAFGDFLLKNCNVLTPPGKRLIDLHVSVIDGSWVDWNSLVPRVEIDTHKVTSSDVVIATTDTLRHTEILKSWLSSHKPVILCGPPGSGKTMILTSVLESIPEFVLASLNFSSGTTPELIIKTFIQYCEIVDSPEGLIMQPSRQTYTESQWLVVFCDEINLPEQDIYGTQKVIMFIRQLTDQNGYFNDNGKWVALSRIQFAGACNPPTDAGRVVMSPRFMRHSQLLFVDYPSETSLKQIYRSFNNALFKLHPNLKGYVDPLTHAMVEFYIRNQSKFTADIAPQYIYSPRELSRWVRALFEVMEATDAMTAEEFVRLWAHSALRLFHDRLIMDEDKQWCNDMINEIARKYFGGVNYSEALRRPILFSNFMRKRYESVEQEVFRQFVASRLKTFYEEELDVPLVVFDDVIEHVLRIDTVLRQPMGHLLLVGDSGVGKSVLTRFVAWINALAIFQIKTNSKYTLEQFDDELRELLRRVGVNGEKVCFIFDENNVLSSAFLEKMNALLASGEIPGLFEGDSRAQLLSACRESYNQRDDNKKHGVAHAKSLDSDEELWSRFVQLVQQNLHVVFTMNPASSDFDNRYTTSPALFNRCVVDWFGTWSPPALAQVGFEFTASLDISFTQYTAPSFSYNSLATNKAYADNFSMVLNVLKPRNLTLHEAVVASLVAIHEIVKQTIHRQKKSVASRQFYLSPRDYLDFIRKFMQTENDKRSYLEDRQTHIQMGLEKLKDTEEKVNDLRKEMVKKESVLRYKDHEANEKLKSMIEKQNEAEGRKKTAEELTMELWKQNEEIRVRLEQVEKELGDAEPSLQSAKQAVENIKKSQLDEVRSLSRPPEAVQLTMEMICIMIGEKNLEWTEIRKVIRRDDFISIIVNFDPTSLNPRQIKQVQDDYLKVTDLDYNTVDRASKACGPLYNWAHSQIKYSIIMRKIKPLRDEVQSLQSRSKDKEVQKMKADQQVNELESDIQMYKNEYAAAIRDTEMIRAEMETVKRKVERAESLLKSLEREKVRWEEGSATFNSHMSTLIGDCLIAGAFQAYCGNFDHKMRWLLVEEWSDLLDVYKVPHRTDIDITNFLSKPADLLHWKSLGLPGDDLTVQNAILLEKFHRFPLIIDPSGQATNFILRKFASDRITQTSFLDSSFLKTLGSAIRFGTPLLVQDVDNVDPILNPVLNKELQKTGGRTLIRLGSEDIDYSPKFVVILVTRNPYAKFSPDLCSRVTLINFTVTPESLESQALGAILRSERPDVERRRVEILQLQSEQSVHMRELEDSLLSRISAVQGAILDDDTIIKALEEIKTKTIKLNKEVLHTDSVITEVKEISKVYEPLAAAMSATYFSLDKLSDLNPFYQFSLQFFLQIIDKVLSTVSSNSAMSATTSSSSSSHFVTAAVAKQRITSLTYSFFNEVSRRVLKSLKNDDKVMMMAQLAIIATRFDDSKSLSPEDMDYLLKGSGTVAMDVTPASLVKFRDIIPGYSLDENSCRALLSLSSLPNCQGIIDCLRRAENQRGWIEFITTSEPENMTLPSWYVNKSVPISQYNVVMSAEKLSLINLLAIKTFRPDRVFIALERYVLAAFGHSFNWRDNAHQDVRTVVERDSRSTIPIMLCAESGHDASSKVDGLAADFGVTLLQIAMGSAEGFIEADRIIAQGSKVGCWVLLRNVHLCVDWLAILEKKLLVLKPHDSFRLFLSCEINPRLPMSLLRLSEVVVYEASTGVKANITRFLENVPATRIDRAPAERCRVYHMLAWFNAIVHERLRYQPLGWSKKYQFSEADALGALDCIDQWIDSIRNNRAYVNPTDLPWQAIKTTLSQTLYGGKIDQDRDQLVLDSFINHIFNPKQFSNPAVLASDPDDPRVPLVEFPSGLNRAALLEWVGSLPDENPPTWLGLPMSAEAHLAVHRGSLMLSNLLKLGSDALDTESSSGMTNSTIATSSTTSGSNSNDNNNNNLIEICKVWLQTLPDESYFPNCDFYDSIDESASSNDISMIRFLKKEIIHGRHSLILIRYHINELGSYCQGNIKITNRIKSLIQSIRRDSVPLEWKEIFDLKSIGLVSWFSKFVKQIKSLSRFFPVLEAYSPASDGAVVGSGNVRRSIPSSSSSSSSSIASSARPQRNSFFSNFIFSPGDLFFPDSFVIATRQTTAQFMNCSIDELELHLDPLSQSDIAALNSGSNISSSNSRELAFLLESVYLEGASTDLKTERFVRLSSKVHNVMRAARLVWRLVAKTKEGSSETSTLIDRLKLPLYLDSSRSKKVFDVSVPAGFGGTGGGTNGQAQDSLSVHDCGGVVGVGLLWAQRGVCLILRSAILGL